MALMNINTPTYVLTASTTSSNIAFTPQDTNQPGFQVYNSGTVPAFIVSGQTAAPTAVFPTSATVPINGTVIAPGAIESLSKNTLDAFISGITATGTASLYICSGVGE